MNAPELVLEYHSMVGPVFLERRRAGPMPTIANPVRFGPFEVDLASGELRKSGMKLRLADQPLQILALLLEHPGQVVTREELHQHLWASDTFVDFEHGLNAAIKRLRDALGDSADFPHYIETLPRHGYRFIATLDGNEPVGPPAPTVPPETRRERRRWILLSLASVIVMTSIVALASLDIGGLRGRLFGRMESRRIQSLAVLPVKNFSGDPNQDFFADGMTEALIAGLSKIKAVKVISRTSVMHYRDTKETLPQIAKELGVDGIVEASVIRSGDRVRITAQLIEARQDRHLWGSSYEREMTDVLALQSDVVQAIAGEIRVQLTPQESAQLKKVRRVDRDVYDATLRGRATLDYAAREKELEQAINLFQKAIDRDPTYAPAWAGLGEARWLLAEPGNEFVAPALVRGNAIAAAEKALELDETLPEAHEARAVIALGGEWDVAKAQLHFERALELRPSYAAAHIWYGDMLASMLLRFDESRRHLERGRELDPLSPWNDITLIHWWLYQGRPEKAFEEADRLHQLHPTLSFSYCMGGAQLILERPRQAVPLFEETLKARHPERPPVYLSHLGLAYGLTGRRSEAIKILNELEQASQKRYVSPLHLAAVYSGLGRMDEAFQLLDRALEEQDAGLLYSSPYVPRFVAFRRDPRWKSFIIQLRKQVKLPPGAPDPYS